ncbi:MAG: SGNH/GDSL hydrolase family protein [Actinomycetota bacterium]
MPAGRIFVVMLICLLLWGFLFAPTMKRAAEASPDGARRSAALALLTPFVVISDALQITKLTDAMEQALGRDPNEAPGGGIVVPPEPIPSQPGGGDDGQGGGGDVHTRGPIRKPTGTNKLRVAVIGDSLAAGLGVYLERVMKPSLVRVSRQGRISTGLARPDYFDWPAALSEIVDNFRSDLIVVMLGENDNQALRDPAGREETPVGTFDWPMDYGERVEDFMRLATSKGARVVWAGLPIVSDRERWGIVERQNDVFESAADAIDDVTYLDTWDMFAAPDGSYTAYHREDGTVELVRESDGLHFNATGYELLARSVLEMAQQEFDLTPRVVAD